MRYNTYSHLDPSKDQGRRKMQNIHHYVISKISRLYRGFIMDTAYLFWGTSLPLSFTMHRFRSIRLVIVPPRPSSQVATKNSPSASILLHEATKSPDWPTTAIAWSRPIEIRTTEEYILVDVLFAKVEVVVRTKGNAEEAE
jgi:hypothetical protein